MSIDGEWVHAHALPVPASEVETGAIGIAEAARHLAILGSCAVRMQTQQAGRVYYPVRHTLLTEIAGERSQPLAEVHLRARCVRIDELRSEATAIALAPPKWQSGRMALRWALAGTMEAEKTWRRLMGKADMPKLVNALRRLDLAGAASSSAKRAA
ncbi:MAG: hypothetical protein SFX73_00580 [Kofleriaceae bacterium]|nr:hypothetical protein [Kofleriaceae bacterium]